MTAELYDPPAPTPGARHCGGNHYAKALHRVDGTITWYCVNCLKQRNMSDGQGWR